MTGMWQETMRNGNQFGYVCNRCGYFSIDHYKYCPECGTHMKWTKHAAGAIEVTEEWINAKVKGLM
jgi:uncharacterized OB-fold protein